LKRVGELAMLVLAVSLLTASAVLAPSMGMHLANDNSFIPASGGTTLGGGQTPSLLSGGSQGQTAPVAPERATQPSPSPLAANGADLASSAPLDVGPKLVQSAYGFSSGPSVSCRYNSSVSPGDLLIVSLGGLGTETFSSDSLSLSWSHYSLENTLGHPPSDSWSYVYYAKATAGGVETVSLRVSSYGDTFVNCYEVSAVSAVVDRESNGTSQNYLRVPSFSVSSYNPPPGDFVFASGYQTEVHYCSPPDFTAGAEYTYAGVDNCQGYAGGTTGTLGDEYVPAWGGGATTSPMTANESPGASAVYGQQISIAFKPGTVAVPISLSAQDGAPADSASVTCQGGGGTYAATGGTQYFSCTAGAAVTVTLSAGGSNNQWCFSGECVNSVSWTACQSGTCQPRGYTYYEQLRSTFEEALSAGTFASGLAWTYTGYQSGVPGAAICTSSPGAGGTSASRSGWSDYAQPATAPASPSGQAAGERFENSAAGSSTSGAPTTGGGTLTVHYYRQEGETVRYSLPGGGSPVAPNFTYTSLGTAGGPYSMTTSAAMVWVDYGTSWAVGPNPLAGSGSSERWQSAGPLSGTVTAPGTVNPSYYHQYTESIAYAVACDSGAICKPPSLIYYQCGSTTSSVLSTTAQSFWIDSGSIASVSTSITDSLNDVYTPYLSSWLINGADEFAAPVQYWSGL
jgi:hypothetical protein